MEENRAIYDSDGLITGEKQNTHVESLGQLQQVRKEDIKLEKQMVCHYINLVFESKSLKSLTEITFKYLAWLD